MSLISLVQLKDIGAIRVYVKTNKKTISPHTFMVAKHLANYLNCNEIFDFLQGFP